MNESIENIKSRLKEKKHQKSSKQKNNIKNRISKLLIIVILFLSILIYSRKNIENTKFIKSILFENNIQFVKINNFWDKHFGKLIPFKKIFKNQEKTVFKEELTYEKKEKYKNGVKLKVSKNYLIPNQESGMVVFIGDKENYGNTVIIQQMNGIDLWYGNVENVNVKLYDYIEKGELIGETKDENLYLVYKKEGEILDYEKQIN